MTNQQVEVIFVPENAPAFHQTLHFTPGMTVLDALNQSGVYNHYPETKAYPVGIFSKKVSLDYPLKVKDRVEIYRPLLCNPKERRRIKAKLNA